MYLFIIQYTRRHINGKFDLIRNCVMWLKLINDGPLRFNDDNRRINFKIQHFARHIVHATTFIAIERKREGDRDVLICVNYIQFISHKFIDLPPFYCVSHYFNGFYWHFYCQCAFSIYSVHSELQCDLLLFSNSNIENKNICA